MPPPVTPKTQAPAAFGLMPVLTRSMSACVEPVRVKWSPPGTVAEFGMSSPVSRIATRSSRFVVAGVVERRVQDVGDRGELGRLVVLGELGVARSGFWLFQ